MKVITNRKMPVVSRHGTNKLDLPLFLPRLAVAYAVRHVSRDVIKHHRKAGVATDDDLVLIHIHYISKNLFHFWNTVQIAVVAAVDARIGNIILRQIHFQHRAG